jgi:hypothetical protein
MNSLKIISIIILSILILGFVDDHAPFVKLSKNQSELGTIDFKTKSFSIEEYSQQDTLSLFVFVDTGLPSNGKLVLIDSTENEIVIYDGDNLYNQRRDNGKKYSVQFKELEALKMKTIDVFHTSHLMDSLGIHPHFYGRIELNKTLPNN